MTRDITTKAADALSTLGLQLESKIEELPDLLEDAQAQYKNGALAAARKLAKQIVGITRNAEAFDDLVGDTIEQLRAARGAAVGKAKDAFDELLQDAESWYAPAARFRQDAERAAMYTGRRLNTSEIDFNGKRRR